MLTGPSIIAVDFDGTLVAPMYPDIGEAVPNAVRVLQRLHSLGHQLVLFTCRSGAQLQEAIDWYRSHGGPPLLGVNRSVMPEGLPPDAIEGPKPYAHVYIDDRALGCPMRDFNGHSVVDWLAVERLLLGGPAVPKPDPAVQRWLATNPTLVIHPPPVRFEPPSFNHGDVYCAR